MLLIRAEATHFYYWSDGGLWMESNKSLFRSESIDSKKDRLFGEVLLRQTVQSRFLVFALVLVITAAIVWLTIGKYSRTEQARGLLVTTAPSAKIIATRPGVVTKLIAKEGAFVRKGTPIAVVDLERRDSAGAASNQDALATITARMAIGEQQVALTRKRAREDKTRLTALSLSLSRQAQDVERQIAIQRDLVKSNRNLFNKIETVVEKGFVTQIDYERRRQELLISEQALSRLEQQHVSLLSERDRAQAEKSQLVVSTSQEIATIEGNKGALQQQGAQLRGEQAYTIIAPISGRVAALQAAEGRLASPEVPMMVIIPEDTQLQAQIYAPTRAIGFVETGQDVRLLYDAFPYQRFGSFDGEVADISRIVIDPREADVPFQIEEPVYRVTVNLTQQEIKGFGDQVPLQPGMTLTANLVLEEQSFLDWILTPLRAVWNRS